MGWGRVCTGGNAESVLWRPLAECSILAPDMVGSDATPVVQLILPTA
jgi:hypothetical protein